MAAGPAGRAGDQFRPVFNERQRATRAQIEGPPVARFVAFAQRARRRCRPAQRAGAARRARPPRPLLDRRREPIVAARTATSRIAARLRDQRRAKRPCRCATRARAVSDEVGCRRASATAAAGAARAAGERRAASRPCVLSVQLAGRQLAQRPDGHAAAQSLARRCGSPARPCSSIVILLGAIVLDRAAARRGRCATSPPPPSASRAAARRRRSSRAGPPTSRRAILAFNAMSARVGAMLDEKDRMLGAIGHDMRTPLASLRIRAESMEPEAERAAR